MADEKPNHIRPCPICQREHSHLGARGHQAVCGICTLRAVDSTHRPITFSEGLEKQGEVLVFTGPDAYYAKPDPQAGELNQEVSDSFTCWIDGIECQLYEGVAGWLGLIVRPQSRFETRN